MIITAHIKQSFSYAKRQGDMRGENQFIFNTYVVADAEHHFSLTVGKRFLVNGYNDTSCLITYDGIMYSVWYSWTEGIKVERIGKF